MATVHGQFGKWDHSEIGNDSTSSMPDRGTRQHGGFQENCAVDDDSVDDQVLVRHRTMQVHPPGNKLWRREHEIRDRLIKSARW